MSNIYERIVAGETLRVQFAGQPEWAHKGQFTIQRLLMIGEYYARESEIWAQWASVGGIIINGKRRAAMEEAELRKWLAQLEEVSA